jgi:hypothetical protein
VDCVVTKPNNLILGINIVVVQVDYVDIWTNHTPYPFNQLPQSYSYLVQNPVLWRLGYYFHQPRLMHNTAQYTTSLIVRRTLSEAFSHYDPDLVVSVHPLMQMVPLLVLRQRERCALLETHSCLGSFSAEHVSLSAFLHAQRGVPPF